MALDWKPHTTPPAGVLATVLVAYPPVPAVDHGFVGRMYMARFGVIECEQTGRQPTPPYYWVYEHEVLDGIPEVSNDEA
jgi:hypothetical protein